MAGMTVARWYAITRQAPLMRHGSSHTSWNHWTVIVTAMAKIFLTIGALMIYRIMAKSLLARPLKRLFPVSKGSNLDRPQPIDPTPSVVDIPALHLGSAQPLEPILNADITIPSKRSNTSIHEHVTFRFPASEGETLSQSLIMARLSHTFSQQQISVILKVIVYGGIGWLGSDTLPSCFASLGWS